MRDRKANEPPAHLRGEDRVKHLRNRMRKMGLIKVCRAKGCGSSNTNPKHGLCPACFDKALNIARARAARPNRKEERMAELVREVEATQFNDQMEGMFS